MSSIIALIAIAAILFILEVVLPGGILGTIGAIAYLFAVYLTYDGYGAFPAILVFCAGVLFTIGLFIIQIKVLPKTPMGKHIILQGVSSGKSNTNTPDASLIGKSGVTLSRMTPTGMVRIDNRKFQAISQSGMLDREEDIVVVSQDTFRVVVRKKG